MSNVFLKLAAISLFPFAILLGDAHAQERDAAAIIGLNSSSKSLPAWVKPTDENSVRLSESMRTQQGSVFLVGHPDAGYGTAFLISQKHRLLATNAHVADIKHQAGSMMAIPNNTSKVFPVERVWIHPGVRRRTVGDVSVRSMDPTVGPVDPQSPDLAILQLGGDDELPEEFALASWAGISDLFGQPVAMIGFPGHDTTAWPQVGQSAKATYHQGVVCRLTDFSMDANEGPENLQFVQHSMATWFGFSGSPIFDTDGRVVGINNSGTSKSQGGLTTTLAYGVRVDALWEVAVFHDLAEMLRLDVKKSDLNLGRYEQTDVLAEQITAARRLVSDAELLYSQRNYTGTVEKLNQARKLLPNWAAIYVGRSLAYQDYATAGFATSNYARPSMQYLEWAAADLKKAIELEPTNLNHVVSLCTLLPSIQAARTGVATTAEGARLCDKLLAEQQLDVETKSLIYQTRAVCRSDDNTYRDLLEATKLTPYASGRYITLANYWESKGNTSQASANRAKARKLMEATELNAKAYAWAVSSDPSKRDAKKAFESAVKACAVFEYKEWMSLDTLACAYAEAGDFGAAIEWGTKALALTPNNMKAAMEGHLREFRNKRPVRE